MSVETSIQNLSNSSLTLEEVRHRRDILIQKGFESPHTVLIEALPISGKSYGVTQWAAETGQPVTVFAPRHDLLNEYKQRCCELGLSSKRLPSFYRDCDSFEKNNDEEYVPVDYAARRMNRKYKQGLSADRVHQAQSNLPCQSDGKCDFMRKSELEPQNYDVLLGTYRHANCSDWIEGRYVAFDEFPKDAFLHTFEEGNASVISAYIEQCDDLPFRDYTDLLERMNDPKAQTAIESWKRNLSYYRDDKHVIQSPNPNAHVLAPHATHALIESNYLANGWRYADLGYGKIAVRNPDNDRWTFLLPPDMNKAESVICLDGTPNEALWELVLNEQIQSLNLLSEEETREYLQDVLEYRFVQTTTENWRAIQGDNCASPPNDLALIEGIFHREGQPPALISSQNALERYREHGLGEITDTTKHYNSLKGLNDLGTGRVGIVLGCPHPGDDEIEKWAALCGESAERKEMDGEYLRGTDTDYGPFGNEVMKTLIHDEVLQAAMRFGRKEVDGVRGATVYIHTAAIPEWLPVETEIADIWAWTTNKKGMRKTVEGIFQMDNWRNTTWKSTDVYPYISDIHPRTVRNCLDKLADKDYLEFEGKWGQGTPSHYSNLRLEEAGRFGHVEFKSDVSEEVL